MATTYRSTTEFLLVVAILAGTVAFVVDVPAPADIASRVSLDADHVARQHQHALRLETSLERTKTLLARRKARLASAEFQRIDSRAALLPAEQRLVEALALPQGTLAEISARKAAIAESGQVVAEGTRRLNRAERQVALIQRSLARRRLRVQTLESALRSIRDVLSVSIDTASTRGNHPG